jgi:aminopeptidase N
VSDEVAGGVRTARFRTAKPQRRSTLYIGTFEVIEGEADGTKVEVYSDRNRSSTTVAYDEFMEMPVEVRGTSKADIDYSRQEIENAIKVYKKILGPLDLETLRVASTPTGHGRGFEGLLLLSKFGGFDSDNSAADLFRAHEVAHLWWGNVVDPVDWVEDRWLGESFAEYVAMEFYSIRFAKPEKTREWMRQQWVRPVLDAPREPVQSIDGTKRRVRSSQLRPLIDGTQNVYTKGPLVIHMLRNLVVLFNGNDQKFWELLQGFLEDNKGKQVSTQDFIAATEKKLGGQIGWFWDEWLYGSDLPHVRWSSKTSQDGKDWIVVVDAKQEGTAFQLPIPIYVELADGRRMRQYLNLSGPTGRAVVKAPSKPKNVTMNDNFEVLAFIEKE